MSINIRDYVSSDHIESIGEIARGQSAIIQALSLDNSKLERELKEAYNEIERTENLNNQLVEECQKLDDEVTKLQNILKEAREYIEKLLREETEITDEDSVDYGMKCQRAYFSDSELCKVLDILDKENK